MKTIAARLILGGVFSAVLAGTVSAQTYPSRPITAIIPFAGGSASDVVSRIMLDKMSKSMGQAIVIENRPGAGKRDDHGDVARRILLRLRRACQRRRDGQCCAQILGRGGALCPHRQFCSVHFLGLSVGSLRSL